MAKVYIKIPPALWATGGFGLEWRHPSLQLLHPMLSILEEGFTPPPTSSPGLKTVVPNSLGALYIQFLAILVIIIFSPFFLHPVYVDGAQLGSKMAPKSTPKVIFWSSEH